VSLLDSLARVAGILRRADRAPVLVGGLAVSVRAEPRFTRDADFVVAASADIDAESVVRLLVGEGFRLQALLEQTSVGRLSGARFVDPDGIEIDLLFASSGIEQEITEAAEQLEVAPSVRLGVATAGHLIALKLLSVGEHRETDAADLRALARVATGDDWDDAASAVRLIVDRGFARGRDLVDDLHRLREGTALGDV
jgi:hypothetical protein